MLGSTPCKHRFYFALPQHAAVRIGIVGAIALDAVRLAPRMTDSAAHGWNGIDEGQQLGYIMSVGCGQDLGEGNSLGISDEMMLAARLASIGGIRTSFFPPNTARTEELSTIARDQSI